MIIIRNQQTYENLKSSFVHGMEIARPSIESYRMRSDNITNFDIERARKINNRMFCEWITMRLADSSICFPWVLDLDTTAKMIASGQDYKKDISSGYAILQNTFSKGLKDPVACIKAWYDAIAEYVSKFASDNIDNKPPLCSISRELTVLGKYLEKNLGFAEVKKAVFDELKGLYPSEYKSYIKTCEQNYLETVQSEITNMVRKIVKTHKTF